MSHDILPTPTDGLTLFQYRMAMLDAFLTRKNWATVVHTAKNRNASPASMTDGGDCAYYLSDGGYSRICVNIDTGRLFLTSNSRQEVKDLWACCKEAIADLENDIQEYLASIG